VEDGDQSIRPEAGREPSDGQVDVPNGWVVQGYRFALDATPAQVRGLRIDRDLNAAINLARPSGGSDEDRFAPRRGCQKG